VAAALPDLAVPDPLTAAAGTGLATPEALSARFVAVLPEMLAAGSADEPRTWQDSAGNWLQSLLALRPAEEVEGDTPAAIVSRLEAALGRRDYAAAVELFAALPPGMRAAAGDLPDAVAARAAAQAFLAG